MHMDEIQPVLLRSATDDDAVTIFNWQTSPGTRMYARNSKPPTLAEHLRWYSEKLNAPDSQMWIGLFDGRACGFVRLDRQEDEWEISIVIAPHMRSSGLGKAMLKALDEVSGGKTLFAEVSPGNEASHALFRAGGYHLSTDGRYRKTV